MWKSKALLYSSCFVVLCVFGFTIHSAEVRNIVSCTLGGDITGSVCTESSSISGSFQAGASYSASSSYSATNNVDETVRVKVSAVVKKDGVTIATPSQQKTCYGCEALTASVAGSFDTCEGANPPATETITINSTHEFQRTTGGSTVTSYTSDSDTYACP